MNVETIEWMKMIHLIDRIQSMPFCIEKDAVIMGRGAINRDRFLWNLDRVNVFFLNSQPCPWALDYYKRKYPIWQQSLFAFLHAEHANDLQAIQEFKVDIITWTPGTMKKLKTNNSSSACCDFLSRNLIGRNIYLCAFDFISRMEWIFKIEADGRRTWYLQQKGFKGESQHLRSIIRPGAYKNRWYFVTPCPEMGDFYPERMSHDLKSRLLAEGVIDRELTAQEVEDEYRRAGITPPPEPGEAMRRQFNPHICNTCIRLDSKPIVMRQTKPGSSHYCQKNYSLIASDRLSEERECWE